jgi:hypothetical protein
MNERCDANSPSADTHSCPKKRRSRETHAHLNPFLFVRVPDGLDPQHPLVYPAEIQGWLNEKNLYRLSCSVAHLSFCGSRSYRLHPSSIRRIREGFCGQRWRGRRRARVFWRSYGRASKDLYPISIRRIREDLSQQRWPGRRRTSLCFWEWPLIPKIMTRI